MQKSLAINKLLRAHSLARIGILLATVVLGITSFLTFYESVKYTFLSYAGSPARAESTNRSLPSFIHLPSVEIGLPIEETTIKHGVWEVKQDAASHLSTSAVPLENGTIIIYGRKTADQFSRLTSLRKGDTVLITTLNGNLHSYLVTDLLIVSPQEVGPLSNTTSETLILSTSFGFGDLKRFIVQAEPLAN